MEDCISRKEYNEMTQRIHKRVDEVGSSVTRMEALFKNMQDMVSKMHDCIFGNGKPGILTKISNIEVSQKIYMLVYGSLATIQIGTLLTVAFMMWRLKQP